MKNFPEIRQRVILFSGGKTSALMTIKIYRPGDIVLFTDTKREHPLTYKFIDDFEKFEGIPVHRTTYEHVKSPGKQGFDALNSRKTYLPNRTLRICTEELKVLTGRRYLRYTLGIQIFDEFIGFRYDEPDRVLKDRAGYAKVRTYYPLYEMKVTKEMVNQYWLTKPYTLEIPSILGDCDLCFLKGKAAIIRILQVYPELAEKWIHDEEEMSDRKRNGDVRYFKDTSYRQLLEIAQSQPGLFNELDKVLPAFNCSCTA